MKKIKISIRMAVLTILVVSVILVGSVTMYATTARFNEKLLESSISNMENVVHNCRDEVSRSVIKAQQSNDLLINDKSFMEALRYDGTDEVELYNSILKIKSDTSALRTTNGENYGYYGCFFVDSDMPIAKHLEPYTNKKLVFDTMYLYSSIGLDEKKWFSDFNKSGKSIYIFQDEEMPQCVFYAQRLKDIINAKDEEIGISLVGINFQNILRKYGIASGQNAAHIMIFGSDGNLIATNGEEVTDELIAFASDYQKDSGVQTGKMTNCVIEEDRYYAGIYDMDFGLRLVALVSREEVFITIKQTTRDVYIIVLLVLLVILLLTVVLSGFIVRPIKRLSDYMQGEQGVSKIKGTYEGSRVTEIDNLYKAYNSMADRIAVLLTTAETLGEQKKESEFRMLQTQINPHYLYNALDSISWMALRKGDEDISDMASALADSFRYNARTSEMIIDLGGEIEFISNYIKLQEKFRDTEFNLEIDVAEDVAKLQVPKFMLQPLVENAIIHGLKREGVLTIRISASVNDGVLEIRTEDDGIGYNADALNSYLGGDKSIFDTEKIGIVNIHKRLKNKYGDMAGLRYESNNRGGLTAIIALPLKRREEK